MTLALIAQARLQRPDLVLFVGSIPPDVIRAIRGGVKAIATYHCDDVENLKAPDVIAGIPLNDVHFSPRSFVGEEFKARGAKRWAHVPFAYDPTISFPETTAAPPDPAVPTSLTFVGTFGPERLPVLEPLARRFPLIVWGNGWNRVAADSPLVPKLKHAILTDTPLRATLSQSAGNIALLRKVNRDRHTMRTFEIPACGGFMIAERTPDHQRYFDDGKEAVLFSTADELLGHVERFLADPAARRQIAEAGRRRVLADGHSYADRARTIAEVVTEML
jgi:spore maturation protein CgeB